MRCFWLFPAALAMALHCSGTCILAADPPGPAAQMLKLLQSGRVPEQRLPTIVKLVCERGDAGDLAYIFGEILRDDHWPAPLRGDALDWLAAAARNRKIVPSGDLSGVMPLLRSADARLRAGAVELIGLWKVQSAEPALLELAQAPQTPIALRRSSLQALTRLDEARARHVLEGMVAADRPFDVQALAVAVLAGNDPLLAAPLAARVLQQADERRDPGPIIDAFLDLKTGPSVLAAALERSPPGKDVAKLILRHMYSVGRADEALTRVLSGMAGISQTAPPPTPEQVAALVQEAQQHGDPARGEAVFRRKDLSCLNCHAVSKAGGQIGPDLSAIGSSSPIEYLVTSVLDPDQAIKEAFATKIVVTVDGKVFQGILANRTPDALVLKEATGKLVTIPLADIDTEAEGKSLMPKGLMNFMTHGEFLDLVSFLSALGKPGPYAVRSTQRFQRYRVLLNPPTSLLEHVPTLANYEELVLDSPTWSSVYARVNGDLPLADLSPPGSEESVFYLRGDLNCVTGGPAELHLDSADGVTAWLDDKELHAAPVIKVDLTPGEHTVIFRVDRRRRSAATLRAEVLKPAGSTAEFAVADGR
jgi:putative heme-binding domain-containing protein